jgi:hypothetical protein
MKVETSINNLFDMFYLIITIGGMSTRRRRRQYMSNRFLRNCFSCMPFLWERQSSRNFSIRKSFSHQSCKRHDCCPQERYKFFRHFSRTKNLKFSNSTLQKDNFIFTGRDRACAHPKNPPGFFSHHTCSMQVCGPLPTPAQYDSHNNYFLTIRQGGICHDRRLRRLERMSKRHF